MPGIADNALVKAAPLITALGAYKPEQKLTPEVEALIEAVTGERPTSPADALERARAVAPLLAEMVEPLLSMTLSPTDDRPRRRSGTSSRRSATSPSTAACFRG